MSKLWKTGGHSKNALRRVQDEADSMVSAGGPADHRRLLRWFRAAGKIGLTNLFLESLLAFGLTLLSHAPFPDSVRSLLVHGMTSLL